MDETFIRRHAPILRFARGENFFPMEVGSYIRHCSLHGVEGEQGVMYVPPAYVALEDLGYFAGSQHYLVYADRREADEEKAEALRRWLERQQQVKGPDFRRFKQELKERATMLGVSLAQVFRPFHLAREVFEQALQTYAGPEENPPHYYYRVVEDRGYTAVQYWYFYAYNDFATSHGGMNDHEGDWESVLLFFRGEEPVWVAASAHVGQGLSLGRAWEQVEQEGEHPLIYVAAGSHANYLSPEPEPPDKSFVVGEVTVGSAGGLDWAAPQRLEGACFTAYQGRWGSRQWDKQTHKLGDAHGGPPTGPKFNRDASVRVRWERPVTYAGLEQGRV